MKDHRAGGAVAPTDERACVVTEQDAWHAAVVLKRGCNALAPVVPTLIEKCFHKQAAGITQDGDKKKHTDSDAGDHDPLLAEIDLQLVAGRGFDAHRRQLRDAPGLPQIGDGALNRPDADLETARDQQTVDDHRIAAGRALVQCARFDAPFVREPARCQSHLTARLDP
jgi:hypothetical protein